MLRPQFTRACARLYKPLDSTPWVPLLASPAVLPTPSAPGSKGVFHNDVLARTTIEHGNDSQARRSREAGLAAPLGKPAAAHGEDRRSVAHRDGFTLVEILVATVLTLVLMGMVVTVFGTVTEEISNSRASIETADRLRSTQLLLQRDLSSTTARMVPPLRPEENLGYLEYIEGPIGPALPLRPYDSDGDGQPDGYDIEGDPDTNIDIEGTTLGDFDDVLMFTSRNMETPFRGIADVNSISSPVAEVMWFLRGTTLYRRVLLVAPQLESRINDPADATYYDQYAFSNPGFYGRYDLSARPIGGSNDQNAATAGLSPQLVLNTLGDLTKRENRYGHQPWAYPHDARVWGLLGLPTLQECSFYSNTTRPAKTQGAMDPAPKFPDPPSTSVLTTGRWPFPLQTSPLVSGTDFGTEPVSISVAGTSRDVELILPQQESGTNMALAFPISDSGNLVPAYASDPVVGEFQHEHTLEDGFDPWLNPFPWNEGIDAQSGSLVAYDLGPTADGYYADPSAGATNAGSTRIAEDVVLTNVLAFDIKVWDPGAPVLEHKPSATAPLVSLKPGDPGYLKLLNSAKSTAPTYPTPPTAGNTFIASFGAYVDLNYMCRLGPITSIPPALATDQFVPNYDVINTTALVNIGAPKPWFHGPGDPRSHLMGTKPVGPPATATPTIATARAAVYDTWSTHYEYDGINQDGDDLTDEGTDGFDNLVTDASISPYTHSATGTAANGIDDFNELEAPPPYASPLKGLQITIRVFEPDSRQIREVTIVQDFQAEESGTNYE